MAASLSPVPPPYYRSRSVRTAARAAVLVALLAVSCSQDSEIIKREHVEAGDRYVAEKKYREAIIEYRNALKVDLTSGENRLKLADAYMQVDEPQNAIGEYVRAADLLPGHVDAQLKAAQLLLVAGRFEEAQARTDKALSGDPHNVEAQIVRAAALAGLRDVDGAVAQLETAISEAPNPTRAYLALGTLRQTEGHLGLAETSFLQAVRADPESIRAHLTLASFYWSTRRAAEAERMLEAARALGPGDVLVNRMLAAFYLASGRVAEAEGPLKAVADAAPSLDSRLSLADYYASSRRPAEAKALLTQLAADDEASASARLRLAQLAIAEDNSSAAFSHLNGVLRTDPKHVEALAMKAELQVTAGLLDDALQTIHAAIGSGTSSPRIHYLHGRILAGLRRTDDAIAAHDLAIRLDPRFAPAKLELARIKLALGQAQEAFNLAQGALRTNVTDAEARFLFAQTQVAIGDLDGAEQSLRELTTPFSGLPAVQAELGRVHARRGSPAKARTAFEGALKADPKNLAAVEGLTTIDLQENRLAQARARIEAAKAAEPGNDALHLLAGRFYATTNDLPRAEDNLRQAVTLNPNNLRAFAALGQLYVSQRRLPEATVEFEGLAKKQPKSVAVQTTLGVLLEIQGRSADARTRYERALEVDPHAAVAANNLAWMLTEQGGNLYPALQLAERAKARLPNLPQVSHTLGWVYYRNGAGARAVESFLDAVRLDPENASYHLHLGLAYSMAGQAVKAEQSLKRALALNLREAEAQQAHEALTALRSAK